MAWLGDREFWVNLIGFASIASAAIFGLLALFTDYKKDGKITQWGRLYAGGIALSAVFAMTSAVLQKRIAAAEAAAGERAADDQRALQKAQFDTQLGHLTRLNGRMEEVSSANQRLLHDMTRSLTAQGVLLTNAQRGMLLTARLGVQERENTGRVLRSLWDESSRVTGSSISVTVAYLCRPEPGRDFPRLLAQNARAHLRVGPMAVANRLREPLNQFSTEPVLGGEGVAQFESLDQQVTVIRATVAEWGELIQVNRFGPFNAERWLGLERPENWEGRAIELIVDGFEPGLIAAAAAATPDDVEAEFAAEFARSFVIPGYWRENGELTVSVLPCPVRMAVFVNGRDVADAWGVMVQFRRGDQGRSGRVVVKFPIVESSRNVFPRFAQEPPAAATAARP